MKPPKKIPKGQERAWTKETQEGIAASLQDLHKGRVIRLQGENREAFLALLDDPTDLKLQGQLKEAFDEAERKNHR